MDWLNMTWITTYWLPLLLALVIGFILGWLLTGLSPRRKNAAYEAQIADMESRTRKTERDLTDARKQVDGFKSTVAAGETTVNDLKSKLSAAEAEAARLGDERAGFETELQSRTIELADLKMQLALVNDQFDKTRFTAGSEMDSLHADLDTRTQQIAALTSERDAAVAELATVRSNSEDALKSLSSKDAALNESYTRAVNLQRALEDRDGQLVSAQAELSNLRTDVAALNSIKAELEDRLQKARGDVAGEMAVLTSTMIKLKEEQLAAANARVAELTNALNAQKANQAAG
jgi:chromosome segregation ATPase